MLEDALIRLEGVGDGCPKGFERPSDKIPSLCVKEMMFGSCEFDVGIKKLVRSLKQFRQEIRAAVKKSPARNVLHLCIAVDEQVLCYAVVLPRELMDEAGIMGLAIEVAVVK